MKMNERQRGDRRALFFVMAAAALLAGCRDQQEGAIAVAVIGDTPRLADPAAGRLDRSDEVLLGNVAQGLVRFDAQGQIEPGLAERWNVSNDGLSYIFRLASGEWPDGRRITAQGVARVLRRQLTARSDNALKDALGAVDEIVAMTDRVIEIRLRAPRPQLLQLLAQPEMAIVSEGQGTGPFAIEERVTADRPWLLEHALPALGGEERPVERVELAGVPAETAIRKFISGETGLVLGGTFADLPIVLGEELPRNALRFDPVAGLFGLIPAREGGPLADPEVRQLLDSALDRDALVAALGVPELAPRASILQPDLEGLASPPASPEWSATPLPERRPALLAAARELFPADAEEPVVIRVALPEGPGSELVLERLRADWGPLGLQVEAAEQGQPADLRLVDAVAPSSSPAWFLRRFRCEVAPVCVEEADTLIESARETLVPAERATQFADAERLLREAVVFMPIAAPVRWSLVGRGIDGFAENRFARHPLTGLRGRAGLFRRN